MDGKMDSYFLKCSIKTITSSFRNIRFQHGYLPTYPAPPISSIYGFLSACLGNIIPRSLIPWLGIVSTNQFKSIETRHLVTDRQTLSPMMALAEILWENEYWIYILPHSDNSIKQDQIEFALKNPKYALYLGRSEDLATIINVEKIPILPIDDSIEMIKFPSQWTPVKLMASGVLHNIPMYNKQRPENVFEELKPLLFSNDSEFQVQLLKDFPICYDSTSNMGVFLYN